MLNDYYHEQVVDRRKSKSDIVLFVLFLAVLFAFLLLGTLFLGVIAYILAALVALVFAVLLTGIPTAFEYELNNYYFRVDAVYKRRKRREMMAFDIRSCETVAPQNAPVLTGVKPDRFYLYHSEKKEEIPYAVLFKDEDGLNCVLLNLDEQMLEIMQRFLGTKVHRS